MSNLNQQDIHILIDAVEAWEHKDSAGEFMADMLTPMLTKGLSEESRSKFEAEEEKRRAKLADEKRTRKERSILLRAKLIQMLDEVRANDLAASVFGRD